MLRGGHTPAAEDDDFNPDGDDRMFGVENMMRTPVKLLPPRADRPAHTILRFCWWGIWGVEEKQTTCCDLRITGLPSYIYFPASQW